MKKIEEIVDCHYRRYACCGAPDDERVVCYSDDGCYFDHVVKDSKKEAKECMEFRFCDAFPKH